MSEEATACRPPHSSETRTPLPTAPNPTTAWRAFTIERAHCLRQVSGFWSLVSGYGNQGPRTRSQRLSLHAAQLVSRLHRLEAQAADLLLQQLVGARQQRVVAGMLFDHVAQVAEVVDQQLHGAFPLGLALQRPQQIEDHVFDLGP